MFDWLARLQLLVFFLNFFFFFFLSAYLLSHKSNVLLTLFAQLKCMKHHPVCEKLFVNMFPQVVHKSRQWWVVRNNLDEEGHVPPNVLEPMNREEPAVSSTSFPLFKASFIIYCTFWFECQESQETHKRCLTLSSVLPFCQRVNRPPNLDMKSSPEEVRTWLQYKGFSSS